MKFVRCPPQRNHNECLVKQLPTKEIICKIEATIQALTTKVQESNLSRTERNVLSKKIVVLQADKGNCTVIVKRKGYDTNIKDLLEDPVYKKIDRDFTTCPQKTTKAIIKMITIPQDVQTT